ncbi:MAG: ribosome silencing factor [Bacilli bacterium]|nr:ribosome silencing factor [Bacilli bacterium]
MSEKLRKVVDALDKLVLTNIRIFDFRGYSPFFDYQVIASASNERQVHAAIDHLRKALPDEEHFQIEGQESDRWLLFDLGDIIVHVMHKEEREYYQFETLFISRPELIPEDI